MNVSQHRGAFVIRFETGTDLHPERFEGRVEHVGSGQSAHFYSRVGLVTFLERALKQARDDEFRLTQIVLGNSDTTLQLSKGEETKS